MKIKNTIEKYLNGYVSDPFHRYKAWDFCYLSFMKKDKTEVQALELAFYLASWGMYRGSSGLLQRNHLIHNTAVDIIYASKNQQLKCNQGFEVSIQNIDDILELKKELFDYYRKVTFLKNNKEKTISPTDTLLSKIILGTLGCVPAYDRYFIDGLKIEGIKNLNFDKKSLNALFLFIDKNKDELLEVQKIIFDTTNIHYPLMKIVDMYFWQIGFDQ